MPAFALDEGFYSLEMIWLVFQNSIPEDHFKLLLEGKVKLPLTPQEKIITIMFTDIVGYTTLMESMRIDGFVSLLKAHLTMINAVTISHGGYIDKFLGDSAMIIWGAPAKCDPAEQAFRACSPWRSLKEARRWGLQ